MDVDPKWWVILNHHFEAMLQKNISSVGPKCVHVQWPLQMCNRSLDDHNLNGRGSIMAINSGPRSKYWCGTLNNPEGDTNATLELFRAGGATYAVVGDEVGESGTRHHQVYLELPKRVRLARLRTLFGERFHWEARRGNAIQASEYCKKENSYVELGSISQPNQGRVHIRAT